MTVCNVTHLLPHGGTDLMGPQHDYASFGNDKWEMENLHSKRTLHVDHFYNRLDFALRNKRRPVSYNLFDLGPAAGETSDSWRAGQNQRRNLFRETLYRAFVISPHPHAQLQVATSSPTIRHLVFVVSVMSAPQVQPAILPVTRRPPAGVP